MDKVYKKDIKVYYPLKHEPREIQLKALENTKTNIRRGKKFIMLNLPTGSGKSLFSVMFINWYLNYINEDAKFDILTNTKVLQNQYTEEFDFIASLKGKNAYQCSCFPDLNCQEAKELNFALKRNCSDCPYDKALLNWKTQTVTLSNFSLFNTFSLFLPDVIQEKKSNVLIVDECHEYESVLSNMITLKISKMTLRILGFNDLSIVGINKGMQFIKSVDDFVYYIENTLFFKMESLLKTIEDKLIGGNVDKKDKIKYSKNIHAIKSAKVSYKSFLEDYKTDSGNWVIDLNKNYEEQIFKTEFIVSPIWGHKYLKKIIWDKFDTVLFLSGTILSPKIFSYMNGLDNKLSSYYQIDTSFPVENRPIFYIKVGKMTYSEKNNTWENQKKYIRKIIEKHKGKKGIIHTSSFELSNWVEKEFGGNDRFIFHTSDTKEEALFKHLNTDGDFILVSPSITTGLDFSDSAAEFQIILKVPYPNIKSNKIKQRQLEYKKWYYYKTCCDLIQMYGRINRHDKDKGITYILDSSFSDILINAHDMIPKYITDAIKLVKM